MITVFKNGTKVNFVDEDNNFVGFDMDDACCSHGGYFFSDRPDEKVGYDRPKFPPVDPDLSYCQFAPEEPRIRKVDEDDYSDNERTVAFRIVNRENSRLFLILFNLHNGFYSKIVNYEFGLKEYRL